jgi:hypothetical protein
VAFVFGEFQGRTDSAGLFRAMVARAGVAPFLFATDRKHVIFAGLSVDPRQGVPGPPHETEPLLRVLKEHLRGIVVVREELEALSCLVQHRYDNPLASLRSVGEEL